MSKYLNRVACALYMTLSITCAPQYGHAQTAPPEVVQLDGNSFARVDNVNIRNGDFFISYGNFVDGHGVNFDLTYNSLSTADGWFGKGWGSPFEARMIYLPDGTAIVHENGTGAYTVYGTPDEARLNAEIQQMIAAKLQSHPGTSVSDYRNELVHSPEARFVAAQEFHIAQAFPKNIILAVDTSTLFNGEECSAFDTIESNERIVTRNDCQKGKIESFNLDGTLSNQYYDRI